MRLTVSLTNGTTLAFEGDYDELADVVEDFVRKYGTGPTAGRLVPDSKEVADPLANGSRRWSEQSARKLSGLLYGEQEKVVRFLLDQGGKASYAELKQHLGYGEQKLSGILSAITRNAQAATGDRLARLVDWRTRKDGEREYYIDPEALPVLQKCSREP